MKCNIQITSVVIIGTLILCSMLLTAHSAPTPEQRSQEVDSLQILNSDESQHRRSKRAIIFRPLFVYRQQQIQKQHVQDGLKLPKSNPYKQDIDNYAGQLPAAFFL